MTVFEKKIWFIYIFVQRACSLDFFSILKGKCDADIMQKRTKGKSFVENSAKKVFWSSYTFVQIAFSQDFIRILEENCGGNINDRRPRFNSFVENAAKKVFWFRYLCRKTAFLTLSESFTRKLWRRVSTSITEELTVRVCSKSCKDLRFLRTSHFLNNFFSFVRLHC